MRGGRLRGAARRRRRERGGVAAEGSGLGRPRTLLSESVLAAALQPTLQEAAEAAEQDDGGPHQPEPGEAAQEGVGAVRHHHGDGGMSGGVLQTAER